MPPASAAMARLRQTQRQARSAPPCGRARIGRPSRKPPQVVGQRQGGGIPPARLLCRHFRQIVSRSRGSRGRNRDGVTGSSCTTWRRVSSGCSALNGGRPVSIS